MYETKYSGRVSGLGVGVCLMGVFGARRHFILSSNVSNSSKKKKYWGLTEGIAHISKRSAQGRKGTWRD